MKAVGVRGRSSIAPCLLVDDIQAEVEFLRAVFGAEVRQQPGGIEGTVWQVEMQLGSTTLMIGRANSHSLPVSSMLYVWIDDVDAAFARAVARGATLISAPNDQPSGRREAGFKDPQGNIWWLGRQARRLSNREVEIKLAEERRARL